MSKQPSNLDYVCMSNDEYLRERLRQMDNTLSMIGHMVGRIELCLTQMCAKRALHYDKWIVDPDGKDLVESKNVAQTHAS